MKRIKKIILILCIGCLTCFMTACGEEKPEPVTSTPAPTNSPTPLPTNTPSPTPIPTSTPTPSPTEVPEDTHEGMIQSQLTGLWIPEETANYRPYAVMINNIKVASPQSGLSEADILYEALVEYGITRLMAIFEADDALKSTTKRIGSIRSARHYYISFANEYDAIFVHFGKTPYAEDQIKAQKIDDIDGIGGSFAGHAFSRDEKIQSPHNVFLNFSTLLSSVSNSKMRAEKKSGQKSFFNFYEENTTPTSDQKAEKITIKFSGETQPYFVYRKDTGLYDRYSFGIEHKDINNNTQLQFKNIIIQFVKEWDIDKNGYQTMKLDKASGSGLYITNGVSVPITWDKNEAESKRHFYDKDGNELHINAGKTYIAVFPDSRTGSIVFE